MLQIKIFITLMFIILMSSLVGISTVEQARIQTFLKVFIALVALLASLLALVMVWTLI